MPEPRRGVGTEFGEPLEERDGATVTRRYEPAGRWLGVGVKPEGEAGFLRYWTIRLTRALKRRIPALERYPAPTTDALAKIAADPDFTRTAFASSPLSSVDTWKSPVLLIHGDDDRTVPISTSDALAHAFPGHVSYERFANTGHCLAWNVDRTRYEAALARFLAEDGKLRLPIDQTFAFDDIGVAFAHMEANRHLGKIVVTL